MARVKELKSKGLIAVRGYVQRFKKRQALEAQIDVLKNEMNQLQDAVLEYFQRQGVDRQSLLGKTIAPRYELWAGREKDIDAQEIHDTLIAEGLGRYAMANMSTQSMSAYIREIYEELNDQESQKPKEEQGIVDVEDVYRELFERHPGMKGKLRINEKLKISVTNAGESKARGKIAGARERASA